MFLLIPTELYGVEALKDIDIRVLATLYNMGKYMDKLYPSNEYIADMLHTSKRTISRSISKLDKMGYMNIEITKRNNRLIYITKKTKELYNEDKPKDNIVKIKNPLDAILEGMTSPS